jgi:hypothetical protein
MSLTLIFISLKDALHTTGRGGSSAEVDWEKGSAGHMNDELLECWNGTMWPPKMVIMMLVVEIPNRGIAASYLSDLVTLHHSSRGDFQE